MGVPSLMERNTEWDWPYMLYAAKVWLKYSEVEFWEETPIKFHALLTVHFDIQKAKYSTSKQAEPAAFIDQINW